MKNIQSLLILSLILLNLLSFGQSITNITPNHACRGQAVIVTISGQNTHFAQGTNTSVWFSQGSQTINSLTNNVISPTSIMSHIIIHNYVNTGLWNVNVYNYIDGSITKYGGFTVNPATNAQIVNVTPSTVYAEDTLISVSITGQNTNFMQGTGTTAWFIQGTSTLIPISNLNAVSSTLIKGDMNITHNTLSGPYQTMFYNSIDGQLMANGLFIVNPISIEGHTASFDFDIYPNPFSNIVSIKSDIINATNVEIKMYDVTGKEVLRKQLSANNGIITNLNTSKLPSGLYFIQLNIDGEVVVKRVLKN